MPAALVLAAGLGTRLDPLTRLVAKPAVPIGGRTLIEWVLAWLVREGIRDVVMNLHHRPDSITTVVGDGVHLGLRVRYSWEPRVLGSGGGPRRALPLIESDPFFIVNGDTLCEVDLAAMAQAHAGSGAEVTLAVVPNHDPARYNGIRADRAGAVTGFAPKGEADGTWHFVGVQLASQAVFAPLVEGQPAETIAGFYRDMIANAPGRIRIWPVDRTFTDVGTPRDCWRAALAAADASGTVATRDRQVFLWPGATLDPRADLHRAVVAGPVHVPGDVSASDVVIVPAALVRTGDPAAVRGEIALFPLT